jgi:ABC-type polysaccharide/polyol phosphate transport system ATPase subunit/ABC-type polysaccharide/polyol phosphate export permease
VALGNEVVQLFRQMPDPALSFAPEPRATASGEADEVAISVRGVTKEFRLPDERYTSLRDRLLHRRFRDGVAVLTALRDVSLDIGRGTCVGIVGRNGSGKSTLLRCMAGIYLPDAGEVRLGGRLAPFIELGVGFDREMTARDNVVTSGMLFGLSAREVRSRLSEIVSYAELERFVDVKLKNFSSGMQTRLGFALTTHIDAQILLFDEVIATGDLAFQRKCFDRFAQLKAERRTLVIVTHDMGVVESLCDRAVLLERGEVVFDGEATGAAERYDAINLGDDPPSVARRAQRQRQRALGERLGGGREGQSATAALQRADRHSRRRTAGIAARFAAVEYRRKYTDAALGYAWAVLRPLVTFAALYIVFTQIAHFDAGVTHYAVYLLSSLVLWTFFLDATSSGVYSLVSHADLLRKVPISRSAMPLSVVMRAMLDLGMNLIAVAVFLAISGISPRVQWLELPLLLVALAIIATGVALLLSALYVRLRDIDQLWGRLAQILFYASPILYVISAVPKELRTVIMLLNPLATIFTQMRHALIDASAPSAAAAAGGTARLLVPGALTVILLLAGILTFRRLAPHVAEDL